MIKLKTLATFLTLATALLFATSATAAIIPLTAAMDGAKANAGAGSGSGGTGLATITLDDATLLLSWNITWAGLTGTPSLMHFHGPALPNQNAGVQVSTGVVGPPVVGNSIISAAQAADLLAGLWYLNLHTNTSPGGEIRGQVEVVPEPGTALLVMTGLLGIAARQRQRI